MTDLTGKRKLSPADLALMCLSGVLTFAVAYTFALRGVDPHHDGVMLKTAADVAGGLALYRETFTQYGSLVIYVFALFVKLFGVQITSIQLATCLAYGGCAMLLYAIVRRYAGAVVAFLCPLVTIGLAAFWFWNFHPWSSVFALLLSMVACLFMMRYTETRKNSQLFFCGLATAAMFWCRQPAGLTAACGLMMLLGLWAVGFDRFRPLWKGFLWFAAGNVLVHAVFLGVILVQGAFSDWWIQAIRNAFTFAAEPTPETAANLPDTLWELFFIGVKLNPQYDWLWRVLTHGTLTYFIVLLAVAFRQKKTKGAPDGAVLGCIAFAAFSLFNWVHYYPTLCYRHMFWSDYTMVGVLAVGVFQGAAWLVRKVPAEKTRRLLTTGLTCCLVVALCATNLFVRVRYGKSRLTGGGTGADFFTPEVAEEDTVLLYHRADWPFLNGLYLSERETRFYDGLFDAVTAAKAAYPEKNVVNVTPNALFSLFSLDNVHLHAFALRADGYPEQTRIVDDYIKAEKPILISCIPYEGYRAAVTLTDFNGDYFRFAPMMVLLPEEE